MFNIELGCRGRDHDRMVITTKVVSLNPVPLSLNIDRIRFMVFNATFNNISVISWLSVLLVEETRLLGEDH